MKTLFNRFSASFLMLVMPFLGISQHYYSFQNVAEMKAFFKYSPDKQIISGHRGTVELGFPENSIAGFEEVLKHSPAIFEIDPRLTKDSVVVLLHDERLERTTNGIGKVGDFTWEELKKLRLKDRKGNITNYRINTLEEAILWAKGKTILNLDKKDVPLALTASIIRKHQAYAWVWVTAHKVDQVKYYLSQNPNQFFSMHVKTPEALEQLKKADLPLDQMIVYIGPEVKPQNKVFYEYFHPRGVMCMISAASSYDKLFSYSERKEKYKAVFKDGASILETDFPISAYKAIQESN